MASRRTLIRGGTVLTMDPSLGELTGGEVLVDGSTIAAVGFSLEAGEAEILDATDGIVLPGFVDTHRHTWQFWLRGICADWTLADYFLGIRLIAAPCHTPEDLRLANELGALEALDPRRRHGIEPTAWIRERSPLPPPHDGALAEAMARNSQANLEDTG